MKLITAIIKNKDTHHIIESLEKDFGVFTANKSTARGDSLSGIVMDEMRIITVVVDDEKAETVFEYIYFEAGLDIKNNGIIYQQNLKKATPYTLPKFD